MRMLFDADLSVERLIPALSIESGTRITPEDTLVIFDEVQEVPRAMTSLKMFNEAAPEHDVLATGSALGIAMHPGFSFPVGKVSRLKLYPMSFVEFLYACKQYALAEMVVPEFLRTLVFARPRGDDQFADCTFSPSLDMSR